MYILCLFPPGPHTTGEEGQPGWCYGVMAAPFAYPTSPVHPWSPQPWPAWRPCLPCKPRSPRSDWMGRTGRGETGDWRSWIFTSCPRTGGPCCWCAPTTCLANLDTLRHMWVKLVSSVPCTESNMADKMNHLVKKSLKYLFKYLKSWDANTMEWDINTMTWLSDLTNFVTTIWDILGILAGLSVICGSIFGYLINFIRIYYVRK